MIKLTVEQKKCMTVSKRLRYLYLNLKHIFAYKSMTYEEQIEKILLETQVPIKIYITLNLG